MNKAVISRIFLFHRYCLIGFILSFNAISISAKTFMAPLDNSQWYLSSSIFECSLTHNIPRYGTAVFYHEAGEDLKFFTNSSSHPMATGKAALVIESSEWNPGRETQQVGYVRVQKGSKSIELGKKKATVMLSGLLEGMAPTFTRKAWYGEDRIRVRLNSINFASSYDEYVQCLTTLLPVNFRQVERTRIHFSVDKAVLTDEDISKLDKLIIYVKADSAVSAIFVDGHTDSSGRRIYNRRLSKSRAEVVNKYLIDHGLNPDMIRVRYHGERYPVAKNDTKKHKALNRRTTVRLVKGQVPLPSSDIQKNPLASLSDIGTQSN